MSENHKRVKTSEDEDSCDFGRASLVDVFSPERGQIMRERLSTNEKFF